MSNDKKTIGLTPENRNVAEALVEMRYFRDQIDAAKFAMSIAIHRGEQPSGIEGAETIWNVGSFDSEGKLKNLIINIFPNIDTPYRTIEYFANVGFQIIAPQLQSNMSVTDLMALLD
ncbi:MAG: hypothetical protein K9K33_18310 [Desulfarculaceae bacterium]|nr:hypothetical protein [Desulfarculaceae bacterium]